MFILESIKNSDDMDERIINFIKEAENYTYSLFTRINLEEKIKKSLANFLEKNKLLINQSFDERIVFDGSCDDIDID